MRTCRLVVALLVIPACVDAPPDTPESASFRLGGAETAQWKRMGGTTLPDGRYGQAMAFDEARGVIVLFGGLAGGQGMTQTPTQDVWEWDPAVGTWKLRPATGASPAARSGAAMAYDAARKVFVLFGGRAGSGYDLQDTWEWDPATGAWADKGGAGSSPAARSQHGMVFDSKGGKIVLFGGGRSQLGGDPMSLYAAFSDTWEYDGTNWSQRTTTTAPSARAGFGFATSGGASRVYLFGGMEILVPNTPGTPKQDIWEYDGEAGTWTERTAAGSKPSPRFGHGMAIDASGQVLVFGGFDIGSSGSKKDVWSWSPTSATWQGHEAGGSPWPRARQWASLVVGGSAGHAFLVAGLINDSGTGPDGGVPLYGSYLASREVWELDPSTTTWVERSSPSDSPAPRQSHAITADPLSGKVYVFGGSNEMGDIYDDLWEWNGSKWVECTGEIKPQARSTTAMVYDPVRKSLILFGGDTRDAATGWNTYLDDTWEWSLGTRQWSKLQPTTAPGPRAMHAMVTDTAREKIILIGGSRMYLPGDPYSPNSGRVWEWDGATSTWTDRTTSSATMAPEFYPMNAVYDESRKKVAILGGGVGNYWEWDPITGGWAQLLTAGGLEMWSGFSVAYDGTRRRTVAVGVAGNMPTTIMSTFELSSAELTWNPQTTTSAPSARWTPGLAFDQQRGVLVLFGGLNNETGITLDDTWEYSVSSWTNGTGCTAETAARCSSGNCVDGVCCESATCEGACKSCNVVGKAGTCVLAAPGTQISGSCSGDLACDSTGECKTSNGKACSSATECASGFCTDGLCCDSSCTDGCASCNQAGRAGTCTPFAAGTDPRGECSQGTPPCQSACDGRGGCFLPIGSACGSCGICDGTGTCQDQWYCGYVDGGARDARGDTLGGGGREVGGFDLPPGDRRDGGGLTERDGGGGIGGSDAGAGRSGSTGTGGSGGTAGRSGSSGRSGGTGGLTTGGTAGMGGTSALAGASGTATSTTYGTNRDGGQNPRDGGGGLSFDGGGLDRSNRSDGDTDARTVKLGNSGCGCRLGDTHSSQGMSLLLFVGLAWLTRRSWSRSVSAPLSSRTRRRGR